MAKYDGAMAEHMVASLWLKLDCKMDVELSGWCIASSSSDSHPGITNKATWYCPRIKP